MKKKGCKSKQQQILRAFPTIWVMFFFPRTSRRAIKNKKWGKKPRTHTKTLKHTPSGWCYRLQQQQLYVYFYYIDTKSPKKLQRLTINLRVIGNPINLIKRREQKILNMDTARTSDPKVTNSYHEFQRQKDPQVWFKLFSYLMCPALYAHKKLNNPRVPLPH